MQTINLADVISEIKELEGLYQSGKEDIYAGRVDDAFMGSFMHFELERYIKLRDTYGVKSRYFEGLL